ncbi:MAG: hypothetical protein JO246_09925 [Frankiaceae bacterium]|nr:hypothetical protein [Frankiaceae bacterium]MBV9870108.1 hypothetical protein [Frankiaceae bacterium]
MTAVLKRICLTGVALAAVGGASLPVAASVPPLFAQAPRRHAQHVGHVWTIMLENKEFSQTFHTGRQAAPYLTKRLRAKGKLIVHYFGTGHYSLDNYLAMISGQGPNSSTQRDCDTPSVLGGRKHKWRLDHDGQAIDRSGAKVIGCTYPMRVRTLADQLSAHHVSWRGYMENMDATPGKRARCSNPYASGPATPSRHESFPDYQDKHNPFGYFHSIIDRPRYCKSHVVPMGHFAKRGFVGPLRHDLRHVATTPRFSYLTPDQCHDGHDSCPSNGNVPLAGADHFLRAVVPLIRASPAYKRDGLIVITFDEGTTDRVCCGEKKAPNLPPSHNNGFPIPGSVADGGGMVGALFLSPLVRPGTVDRRHRFNHYSYLRSMEDLFGIRHGGTDGKGHLGYAARRGLLTFQKAGVFPG